LKPITTEGQGQEHAAIFYAASEYSPILRGQNSSMLSKPKPISKQITICKDKTNQKCIQLFTSQAKAAVKQAITH